MKKKTRQLLILNGLLILIVAAASYPLTVVTQEFPSQLRFTVYSNRIWREPP